jgi:hypothetical protein
MEAHNCYPVSLEQIHADIKAHKTSQFWEVFLLLNFMV